MEKTWKDYKCWNGGVCKYLVTNGKAFACSKLVSQGQGFVPVNKDRHSAKAKDCNGVANLEKMEATIVSMYINDERAFGLTY